MGNKENLIHSGLSKDILGCCFEIANELGSGFLENVYKNALCIALRQKGIAFVLEQPYEIFFRDQKLGHYIADLVIENSIIIELKCCQNLLAEHQAQLINYLKASGIPIGLLVNFGHSRLEYKRLQHPNHFLAFKQQTATSSSSYPS